MLPVYKTAACFQNSLKQQRRPGSAYRLTSTQERASEGEQAAFLSHKMNLEPNVMAGSYALRKSITVVTIHEATANGRPKTRNKTDTNFLCYVAR